MENNLKSSFSFNEDDLITFQEGLFGFEQFKKFLPVSVEENNDAVLCLQSVEDEELSFVIMNPFFLKEDYDPQLSEADRDALGVTSDQELSYYVLCVAREPSEESTVNLKSRHPSGASGDSGYKGVRLPPYVEGTVGRAVR